MKDKKNNILITGGAGFIGSNLALEIQENYCNSNIIVIDDFSLGTKDNLKKFNGKIYKASILDYKKIYNIIKKNKINEIYHLAASSASPMFYKNILHCNEVNVMGFLNILEAARINKVNKVVYASTSSIYGANKMPFTENKIDLTTFYPITKYVNELYAKQYTKEGWLDTTGCRFFSVYGPHEKGKKDFANFLTQSIWNMSNDKPAIVFGDGKQTRDFIFVRDICRGLIACMKCKEASGKIINIGTGIETNILDMIDLINKALNTDIKPLYVPNPIRGYVKYTKSDTSLMDSLLKFKPSVKIEDGIKITAQFYNNGKKGKN